MNLNTLFLGWKAPSTRWFTVGRLDRAADDGFAFAYTKGVFKARSKGFAHVMGFPQLDQTYNATSLFPFFKNRVMPQSRPDHAEYLQRLGLDVKQATPWDQLTRSGGDRSTDGYEIFPNLARRDDGSLETLFFLRGTSHIDENVEKSWLPRLKSNTKLYAMLDLQNEFDKNAVALRVEDDGGLRSALVGYLPRYLSDDVANALCDGRSLEVSVEHVNPPPAPHIHRVQCRLTMAAPSRVPMSGGDFAPLGD